MSLVFHVSHLADLTRRMARVAVCALLVAAMGAAGARAADLAFNPTAPSDRIIASQLADLGPGTQDGGRNYLDNAGPPGQTFTVSAAALAGKFTLKGRGDSGLCCDPFTNAFDGSEVYAIQIAAVNLDGSLTQLALESAAGVATAGAVTDFVTFTLDIPVPVVPGVTYAFSAYISHPTQPFNWLGLAHSDADVYASGTGFSNDNSTVTHGGAQRTFNGLFNPVPYDYVFAVQAVPEPASLSLLLLSSVGLMSRRR